MLGKVVEDVVEHPTHVVLAVIDDFVRLLVPEHWHSDALVIIWCGCFVSFAQKMEAIDRIRGIKRCTGRYLAGWIAKRPAFLIPNRIDNCYTDRFFESFQLSKNRSEEHTSELQSPYDLVCRLLLEKK